MTEDPEILDEVEQGWRTFSARWQQAASAGRIPRELLETQRGFYYAATRHAISMIARAGEQEMLEDPRHGAQRLAERLQRMLRLIDMQAAIVHARRSSRIAPVRAGRLRRLARAAVVILGLGLMLLWSCWAGAHDTSLQSRECRMKPSGILPPGEPAPDACKAPDIARKTENFRSK